MHTCYQNYNQCIKESCPWKSFKNLTLLFTFPVCHFRQNLGVVLDSTLSPEQLTTTGTILPLSISRIHLLLPLPVRVPAEDWSLQEQTQELAAWNFNHVSLTL